MLRYRYLVEICRVFERSINVKLKEVFEFLNIVEEDE